MAEADAPRPSDYRQQAIARSPYNRGVGNKVAMFQQQADHPAPSQSQSQDQDQAKWAGPGTMQQLANKDDSYGRPVEGSKTDYRGKQASIRISGEIIELCNIIRDMGTAQPDGTVAILFGDLFEIYTRISNKLVGMLRRAKKQKLLDFEGEMLFQRRDDHVAVTLLQMPEALEQDVSRMKALLHEHPGNVHTQDHSSFK